MSSPYQEYRDEYPLVVAVLVTERAVAAGRHRLRPHAETPLDQLGGKGGRHERYPTFSYRFRGAVGLGLGGFFDGIVLHQLLQWHHMVSQWYPPTTLANLRLNTLWDGVFHSATYIFVVLALYLLWSKAQSGQLRWSAKLMWGGALMGFGAFNVVEGLVNHHLLGIHHVKEVVPQSEWWIWDLAFLVWARSCWRLAYC